VNSALSAGFGWILPFGVKERKLFIILLAWNFRLGLCTMLRLRAGYTNRRKYRSGQTNPKTSNIKNCCFCRLNLSAEFWGPANETDDSLVPGECLTCKVALLVAKSVSVVKSLCYKSLGCLFSLVVRAQANL
jgi:hypothetical protein